MLDVIFWGDSEKKKTTSDNDFYISFRFLNRTLIT